MSLPAPVNKDLEELMDAVAYLLATSSATSNIAWILGDVGMGAPQDLPYGYVSQLNEQVKWYTANGGQGGNASGPNGVDDWMISIVLTICFQQRDYVEPVTAAPTAGSAFSGLGTLPYTEQPGWRGALRYVQSVKGVLRTNITIGGFAATTQVVESKPQLLDIDSKVFRAVRISLATQQRRRRGT